MLDYNDLRHFLAVARTGSTLAAGKALRVSQTTAARRVSALEAELGLTLFERRPTGYVLTPAGEALVERAEAVEAAANQLVDTAATQSREASGTVKLTVDEIYAVTLLAPTSTTSSNAPSGVYRLTAPPLARATQMPPSASTVSPSGRPNSRGIATKTRRLLKPSCGSKSNRSIRSAAVST